LGSGNDRKHYGLEPGSAASRSAPEWADGLKQLYNSVVEEDLPDSFKDLLDRLEGIAPPREDDGGNGSAAPSPAGRNPSR
jgi:hypothetical protein